MIHADWDTQNALLVRLVIVISTCLVVPRGVFQGILAACFRRALQLISGRVPTSLRNEFLRMPAASFRSIRSVFPNDGRKGLRGTRNKVWGGSSGRVTSDLEFRNSFPGDNGRDSEEYKEEVSWKGERTFFTRQFTFVRHLGEGE